jgi:hypothetical protein
MNFENYKRGFEKPTIITAQQYGTKISVEIDHSDLALDEVMDAFQTLIIGMGYHENSFKNWVIERADEYRETDAEELKEKLEAWKFEDSVRHQYENREELEDDFFGPYDSDEKRMDIIGQNGNEGLHYDTDMGEDYEGQFDEWDNETPIDEDIELNGHVWNDEDDSIVGASDEEGIDWDCTKYDGDGNLWENDEDDYSATLEQDEDRYAATQEDEDEFEDANGGFERKPHFEWGDEPEEDEDLFEGDEWKANQKLVEANERYKKEVKKMNSNQKKKSK